MLKPGATVGGLKMEVLLGRGAMGEVWLATQASLGRSVAVKRIAPGLLEHPEAMARFEREARCLARVQSPHVVAVHDFGRMRDQDGDDHVLLVMELVENGRSLRSALAGALDWKLACALARQIASGLADAASVGVVHRDVKPDNVLLTPRGVAKLADFGLARAVDATGMTTGGSVIGTPAYMSPEACRGETTDERGDVYSLGVLWWQLLAGTLPFRADNAHAMLRMHIEVAPPALPTIAPTVPASVAELVHQCLAKDPAARPPNAAAVIARLRECAADLPDVVPLAVIATAALDPSTAATRMVTPATAQAGLISATSPTVPLPPPPPSRAGARLAMACVALLALGAIAGAGWWLLRDPLDTPRATVARAVAAGDFPLALRLADTLADRFPERSEALATVRSVVEAEVAARLARREYGAARQLLDERRRGREWLDAHALAVRIDVAEAVDLAKRAPDAAEKRFIELRQQHPEDDVVRAAMVRSLRQENLSPSVIEAALTDVDHADAGTKAEAVAALADAHLTHDPYGEQMERVRAALLRARPDLVTAARERLGQGTADDPEPRVAAYQLLRQAGKLQPDEELRFHVRNLECGSGYGIFREAVAWLAAESAKPGWDERRASARLSPLPQLAILKESGEQADAVVEMLPRALPSEIRDALPRWLADDDEQLRWNAWRMLRAAGVAVDERAFHERTLKIFNVLSQSDWLLAAVAYYRAQAGQPGAAEAKGALDAALQRVLAQIEKLKERLPLHVRSAQRTEALLREALAAFP